MKTLAALLTTCIMLSGCSETGALLPDLTMTTGTVVVTKEDAKPATPIAAQVQRKLPKVCEPAAAAIAQIHKVEGNKTPPEAIEAAFSENSRRLVRGAGERKQCYCWMVSEGMVNTTKEAAEKACKGVKLPKVEGRSLD